MRESRLILRRLARVDRERAAIAGGFVCFLAMNAAIFIVYHQIFGDPFVLTILGFLVGGVLGLSRAASPAAAKPVEVASLPLARAARA